MGEHTILTGAILAGGKSSRLGQDKCALVLGSGDVDMLTRTVRLLRKVLDEVVVIGRNHSEAVAILDDVPGAGPVGAITTVLRHKSGPCLILSCDLPFMREQTLSLLIRSWGRKKPGTLVTAFRHPGTGKKENLVAIYEPEALIFLEPRLKENLLKISLVVPEEHYTFVPVSPETEEHFFNINRPEDLRKAESKLTSTPW